MSKFTIQYLLTTFFCNLKWETKVPTTSKSIQKLEQQTTCSNHHLSWLLPSLRFVLLSEGGILSVMMELLFGDPCRFLFTGHLTSRNLGQVIIVSLKTKKVTTNIPNSFKISPDLVFAHFVNMIPGCLP